MTSDDVTKQIITFLAVGAVNRMQIVDTVSMNGKIYIYLL